MVDTVEKFDPKHQTWSRLPVSEERDGQGTGRPSCRYNEGVGAGDTKL